MLSTLSLESPCNTNKLEKGKTILASRIIDHLQDLHKDVQIPVVYFYFRDNDVNKRTFNSMLVAIIAQLVYADKTILGCLVQEFPRANVSSDFTDVRLSDVVERILGSYKVFFFVLDGLDECTDARKVVSLFHKVMDDSGVPEGEIRTLRVLFVGRRNGCINEDILPFPSFRLPNIDKSTGYVRDIRVYAGIMSTKI